MLDGTRAAAACHPRKCVISCSTHLRDLYEFYGAEPGVRIARKHIGWYCSGRPHAQAFRQSVMQAVSVEAQLAQVRDYFDALEDSAAAVAA